MKGESTISSKEYTVVFRCDRCFNLMSKLEQFCPKCNTRLYRIAREEKNGE